MPDSDPRILITAALPYANGPAHLGHLAGAYLPADIYARFQRLMGRDVLFICGSDEHGVPILLRALEEGISPTAVVDRYHEILRDGFAAFGISFDHYGRTSSEKHAETSQAFFRTLAQRGAFVTKTEEQLFDPSAGLFLADRLVRGTCPICSYGDAYGDQCERCGRALSVSELIAPRSALTNATPVRRATTHWYLPLGSQQRWLEEWLGTRLGWKTHVVGQAKSWLAEGLRDRAMTRDLPWGVPVPVDVAAEAGVEPAGKVLYVWFDAPIGYISATQEWAAAIGDPERWRRYWQSDDTKLVHFIGKDNIVFHCLIFPTMLRLHGGYVLPCDVPANEFLNLEGEKFSTSRGWAVWAHEILERFPADVVRYALLGVLPETKDSDFSFRELQARTNELADTLGNLVNRSVKFALQYFGGRVPPAHALDGADRAILDAVQSAPGEIGAAIEGYRFREATAGVIALARHANKYFNDAAPWASRKTDLERCETTLHVVLQVCAALSILCEPMLPATAAKIRRMVGLRGVRSSARAEGFVGLGWNEAGAALLSAGQPLGDAEILFAKIDDAAVASETARLEARRS